MQNDNLPLRIAFKKNLLTLALAATVIVQGFALIQRRAQVRDTLNTASQWEAVAKRWEASATNRQAMLEDAYALLAEIDAQLKAMRQTNP